jgi:hypothetical protein
MSHAASEPGLFRTEQSTPNRGVNSVRSDKGIDGNRRAVVKMRLDVIAVIFEPCETVRPMYTFRRNGTG